MFGWLTGWATFSHKLTSKTSQKYTVDLLLLYGEHFYGFSESDLWKHHKKETFISQQT